MARFTNNSTWLVLVLGIFLISNSLHCIGQSRMLNKELSIGVHSGAVSFFGDLGVNDFNPANKLSDESDFGYGLMIGKKISRLLTVNAEFLNGSIKGFNPELGYSFTNDFWHLTAGLELSIKQLVSPRKVTNFDYYIRVGGGYMEADANKTQLPGFTDNVFLTVSAETPVILTGIGASYYLSNFWKLSARLDAHMTQTDLIDAHDGTSTNINDYYTYLSVGISYLIGGKDRSSKNSIPCSDW